MMKALNVGVTLAISIIGAGAAIAQNAPPVATTKVDGTENVYVFRYGGYQSMFVVTPQGVIATDPASYLRPAKPYIDAHKWVTDKPVKCVIYSHHRYDHAAGGQPFKDLGATFIAHRRAKERLLELKKQNALRPDVVIPDEVVDGKKTHHAWRHNARTHLCRPQPFGRYAGDAAAEGKAGVRRRLRADRGRAVSQYPGQCLAAGIYRFAEEAGRTRLGSDDHRPSLRGRTLRHEKGCSGRYRLHGGFVGGGKEGSRRGEVF